MAKIKDGRVLPKLTTTEEDLLGQMEQGYELETDSLGGNPVPRGLKNGEVIRPTSANRNTIKALEERGVIASRKSREPLTLVWRLEKRWAGTTRRSGPFTARASSGLRRAWR